MELFSRAKFCGSVRSFISKKICADKHIEFLQLRGGAWGCNRAGSATEARMDREARSGCSHPKLPDPRPRDDDDPAFFRQYTPSLMCEQPVSEDQPALPAGSTSNNVRVFTSAEHCSTY